MGEDLDVAAGEVVGEDQYGLDYLPAQFAGKIPTELTEALQGRFNLRARLKGNVPGAMGEDALATLGTDEYVRRLELIAAGKKGVTARAIAAMKPFAKEIGDVETLQQIERMELLQDKSLTEEEVPEQTRVPLKQLSVGDTFESSAQVYEVVDVNPAENIVKLKDGISEWIPDDDHVLIDKGTLKKAGEPKAEKPTPEGIFKAAADKARERIRQRATGERPTAGLDPQMISDWVLVGLDHAEQIIRKAGKLTRKAWTAAVQKEGLSAADARTVWEKMRKKNLDRLVEIEKSVAKAAKVTARPTAVKKQVKETLFPGQPKKPMTERQLLRTVMRKLEIQAPKIYLEAAKDVVRIHKDLAKWSTDTLAKSDITEAEQKRIVGMVAKARTPAQQRHVIASIAMLAERADHREALSEFRAAVKQAKAAKLRPEFSQGLTELLDRVSLKSPRADTIAKAEKTLAHFANEFGTTDWREIPRLDPTIIENAQSKLRDALKFKATQLDSDTLRAMTIMVKHLTHLSNTKNTLLAGKTKRDADKVVTESVKDIEKRTKASKPLPADAGERMYTGVGRVGKVLTASQLSAETRVEWSAGKDSPVFDVVINGIHRGMEESADGINRSMDRMQEQLPSVGIKTPNR
jgi:hypothetical protein